MMLRPLAAAGILCGALAAALAHPGPPPREPAVPVADAGAVAGRLTFSAARPKQPIVVYMEREDGAAAGAMPGPLTIRQKGAQFTPAFAVAVAGQEVVFENDEEKEIDHNVYSLGTEEINLGIFPPKKSQKHVFTKPGEVSLYCSVHKLMDGKLFVAPTAAYAVAADDGAFSVAGVPAGNYILRTYQKARRFRDAELKVTIQAGNTSQVTVEMKR